MEQNQDYTDENSIVNLNFQNCLKSTYKLLIYRFLNFQFYF